MCDLRFDVSLHPLPGGAISGPPLVDPRGTWPTIVPPTDAAGMTMTSDFDAALERLGALERAFVEPDGSFVWVGPGSAVGGGVVEAGSKAFSGAGMALASRKPVSG